MGPLGTMVVVPMFPELREHFGVGEAAVGWALTAYFIPLGLLLIVSGTIGERYGRARVVRATFVIYTLASILSAVAPTWGLFLAARAVQGGANAFITPLLIAGLAEVVPPAELGQAVGRYSSFQAGGAAMAPLVGGLAGETDWRLAFVFVAVAAGLLSTRPPPGEPRPGTSAPVFSDLLVPRVLLLGLTALCAAAGPVGLVFLIGLKARDELGVSAGSAGLILGASTAAAMVCGPLWGKVVTRFGALPAGLVGLSVAALLGIAAGIVSTPFGLAVAAGFVGAASGLVAVVFQSEGATAVPSNRGGSLSMVLAFRFLGHGIGPALLTPVFVVAPFEAFVAAGALAAPAMLALAATRNYPPSGSPVPAAST